MKYIIYSMLVAFTMNVQASEERKDDVDLTPPQLIPTFYKPVTPQEQCAVLAEKRKEFLTKEKFNLPMVRLINRMIKERQEDS